MIITIDGPAGAGKSTVARRLAERLGFSFLETGAMYRAVAWAALERQIQLDDHQALVDLISAVRLDISGNEIRLDGHEVTEQIRSAEVTEAVGHVADNQEVRAHLSRLQRDVASGRNIVTEGRDQGTLVFPDADYKFYLTASAEERARRRTNQLRKRGDRVSADQILLEQNQRDERDTSRPVGGLVRADDAIEVSTDGLTIDQVLDRLEAIALQK